MKARLSRATLALSALVAAALPAAADTLRPDDSSRIERLDQAAGAALRKAMADGPNESLSAAQEALRGAAQEAQPQALLGDWSCRAIKLGGDPSAVAYSPFRCRISADANGAVLLEKLSGSQLVRGRITRDESGRLVLAGVAYITGDKAPDYTALPEKLDPAASPQILSAPGVVEVTGKNSARILFPYPMLESTLDILSLSR